MLPQEDGISILKKLRSDPKTSGIPVIMLTAKDSEYDIVTGLDAGADDYVTKPFGMMALVSPHKSSPPPMFSPVAASGVVPYPNVYTIIIIY